MKKITCNFSIFLKIITHFCFWICVYFFYNYFLGYGSRNTDYISSFSKYLMPVTILVGYFFIYYLIPMYLLKKQQRKFALYSIYTLVISFFFVAFSIIFGLLNSVDLLNGDVMPFTKSLIFIVLGVYFVVFIFISINLIFLNYKEVVRNEDLSSKFLQAQLQIKEQELKFLKMQIHPHFLFNSLNTIYGFALKKKDEAPEMILKLSNLLDYILYQVDKPKVNLQDEINHLEDYVSLEEMRFHDTLHVSFQKENINSNIQIAPMLLIPFLENSFKHGKIVEEKLEVAIKLSIENNMLIFEITNSSINEENQRKGIGLENIQKRLEMLYPNAHQLTIKESENQFKIRLEITIDGLKTKSND